MGKTVLEIDGMQLDQEWYDKPLFDAVPPIVYNQQPFLHKEMIFGEFLEERRYLGEHYAEYLSGNYEPLWKKRGRLQKPEQGKEEEK